MATAVRFAPSPTGLLHIGNIRPAVLNYLFAIKTGGRFLLRLDDTDQERSTPEFAAAVHRDLDWLGLRTDWHARQTDRMEHYTKAAELLKSRGLLYPCYETADELERRRKRQLARGLPPIYDRAALTLTAQDREVLEKDGRNPYWRFRLPNTGEGRGLEPLPTMVSWNDMVRGDQSVDLGSLSDPVLVRADGTFLYTFTSVVDDVDFGITHVIRGGDHVTNTGVQIAMFEALGAVPPVFAHHGLMVNADGEGLSKRTGALSVQELRERGYEPMSIVSYAALVGTSEAIAAHDEMSTLAQTLDLAHVSVSPARFDVSELAALNAKLVHVLPYAQAHERLVGMGIAGGEPFWLAVRGNLANVAEARDWWQVVSGDIDPVVEDAQFLARAAEVLPDGPWDESTWGAWTGRVKAETGAKGRALFHPLRLALTGREQGPELKALLPLIGRERALKRLTSV
ncbi:MAG: glutamate--tRNA ligase [Hyphomicrobiaceae bacterium]